MTNGKSGLDVVSGAEPTTTPVDGLRKNTPDFHTLIGAKIVVAPGKVIDKGNLVLRDGVKKKGSEG